jgi:hypothetical protein
MNNDWSIEQTKKLFSLVYDNAQNGVGLTNAFLQMSKESGKSVNSVRNYYYAQLKIFLMLPDLRKSLGIKTVNMRRDNFKIFSESEINDLVKSILVGKAQGKSIRAVINEKACFDKKLALRYQNKYRSMVATHADKVQKIMNALREEGKEYFNPYTGKIICIDAKEDNLSRLAEYIESLDSHQVVDVMKMLINRQNGA